MHRHGQLRQGRDCGRLQRVEAYATREPGHQVGRAAGGRSVQVAGDEPRHRERGVGEQLTGERLPPDVLVAVPPQTAGSDQRSTSDSPSARRTSHFVVVMPPPIAVTSTKACGMSVSTHVRARSGGAAGTSAVTSGGYSSEARQRTGAATVLTDPHVLSGGTDVPTRRRLGKSVLGSRFGRAGQQRGTRSAVLSSRTLHRALHKAPVKVFRTESRRPKKLTERYPTFFPIGDAGAG